jgi:hypothetical protein
MSFDPSFERLFWPISAVYCTTGDGLNPAVELSGARHFERQDKNQQYPRNSWRSKARQAAGIAAAIYRCNHSLKRAAASGFLFNVPGLPHAVTIT